MSPTIILDKDGPYSFRFRSTCRDHYPHDPHIHVRHRNGQRATFALAPVELKEKGCTLPDHRQTTVRDIVERNEGYILERWNAFFG